MQKNMKTVSNRVKYSRDELRKGQIHKKDVTRKNRFLASIKKCLLGSVTE